jgi:AraC-like DNA-binding protein/ligand-binding sensor protein
MNLAVLENAGCLRSEAATPEACVLPASPRYLPIQRNARASRPVARGMIHAESSGCRNHAQKGLESQSRADNREFLLAIIASKVFKDFQSAFTNVTGLPMALQPVESFQLSCHEQQKEGPFCALMAQGNRTCGACLQSQSQVAKGGREGAQTSVCYAGLCEIVVPLRVGNRLFGFLRTGQVFKQKPTERQFQRTVKLLASWGVNLELNALRDAYFETRVVSTEQLAAAVKLLGIFAEHLALLGNQLLIERNNAEPPMIARAKEFIRQHHRNTLTLPQVAKFANTSTYNFCRLFKRATRLTFIQFLCRVRVESCTKFLLNPQLRISEIAFEAGFQSLTHFNRMFQKITGQTPTEYRHKLLSGRRPVL